MTSSLRAPSPRRGERSGWSRSTVAVGLLALGLLSSSAFGQANQSRKVVTEASTVTADGWVIPLTYYESSAGADAPVVLLLHGDKGTRLDWQNTRVDGKSSFPELLQEKGFAVITADLRKHGEAKQGSGQGGGEMKPIDYKAMASVVPVGDLESIKRFIFEEHQKQKLNMSKMSIVAPGNLAPVALQWAEADWFKPPYNDAPTMAASTPRGQDVKALVLLSPQDRVAGVASSKAATALRSLPVSFLLIWSNNAGDRRDGSKLYSQLAEGPDAAKRVFKNDYGVQLRGVELVGNPKLRLPPKEFPPDQLIAGFLEKQLKDLDIPWRDRRSRLDR